MLPEVDVRLSIDIPVPAAPANSPACSAAAAVAAVYRLTRALGRVEGVKAVSALLLQHVARAVPCRLAAFAVPNDDNRLAVVATHGYPIELVGRLRLVPGVGVIGGVYQRRAPMRVVDAATLGVKSSRSRYRTKSFVALPVLAGRRVVGVLCVTDRLDDGPFTRADCSLLRALVAPAALALARDLAAAQAESCALAAAIDPLSGLFNRRYFQARLDEEMQRARGQGTPVGLLMVDVDDFKSINDRFGHVAGDTVLAAVADIIRKSVRRFDTCARYGGDEFVVLMPASGHDAAAIAERMRLRIEAYRCPQPGLESLRVTASIGHSTVGGPSPPDLVDDADRALYSAKNGGKNRVVGAAEA
jgi:diguanylate cyclase (GGDEF)-like protein